MRPLALLLIALGGAGPKPSDEPPPLPPPLVTLQVDAPDPVGPWKMVVTNKGEIPVRLAADGRLLTLELPPRADADTDRPTKRRKPPGPLVCKLPLPLKPSSVTEDRAVVLGAGARYEEVFSPALYCFSDATAKALVPGAQVVAKLGFSVATPKGPRKPPPARPPFVVEPAVRNPTVSGIKELISDSFVIAAATPPSPAAAQQAQDASDPNGPKLELVVPARVDTPDERTVSMTIAVKNTGGRAIPIHVRRDNLMFDIDGPSGSAHCGDPAERRAVPKEMFSSLAPGRSTSISVWVGEMCPDVAFDRPGLYRLRASLAFPASSQPDAPRAWNKTVMAKDPILVRVREGRLPFYTSPPQVFGGSITFDVNWGDMDAFGHVNNARYFTWFESCRTAYFLRLGLKMDRPSSLGPIVARLSCDYIAPVLFPANLTCGVRVVKIGNTSFTMAYGLWHTENPGPLCARGESVVVLLDYETNQKIRVPDDIRRAIDELEQPPREPT